MTLCTYTNGQALYLKQPSGELHLHSVKFTQLFLLVVLWQRALDAVILVISKELAALFRRGKEGLTDAVRDVDFSRAHANNAVRLCMHRTL